MAKIVASLHNSVELTTRNHRRRFLRSSHKPGLTFASDYLTYMDRWSTWNSVARPLHAAVRPDLGIVIAYS